MENDQKRKVAMSSTMFTGSSTSHEAVEVDVGKKIRRFFFIGTSIGSILTVYCRAITTRQMSEGLCFTESRFSKPYFFALMMATGMSLGLIVDKIQRMCNKEQVIFTTSQLTFRHFLLILLCALCDLYFSVAFTTSAIYVGSSTSVALRFFDLFFVFLYIKFYWKRKFMPYGHTSFFLVIAGCAFVSMGEILGGYHGGSAIWAAIFQLSAQFVSASKSVLEEKVTHDTDVSPARLCGMEGVLEIIILLTIVYPIVYLIPSESAGLHEDLCDAITMVFNSKKLIAILCIYPFISCMFNICVIGIIQLRNGANLAVVEMVNTGIVWLIDLFIHYVLGGDLGIAEGMGVKWSQFSPLRLVGALCVVLSALVFIKVVKLPCCMYETPNVTKLRIDSQELNEAYCET